MAKTHSLQEEDNDTSRNLDRKSSILRIAESSGSVGGNILYGEVSKQGKWTKSNRANGPEVGVELKDRVTVVIPTLNEEEAIGSVIDEVKVQGINNILVADGYSDDRTVEIASGRGANVQMQHGRGKAGALLMAFEAVLTPYLLVLDGDGSYDPADIVKFLPLMGSYDFVKGVRERNRNMSSLHKLGNAVITKTFDLLFGTSIGDVCSGMYLLKTDAVRNLHLEKHPLTVEQEIAAQMVQFTGRVTTVPIDYRRRVGGVSKTKTWTQGIRDIITNFDLARTYNPIMLFSLVATFAVIPAMLLIGYASLLYQANDSLGNRLFLSRSAL